MPIDLHAQVTNRNMPSAPVPCNGVAEHLTAACAVLQVRNSQRRLTNALAATPVNTPLCTNPMLPKNALLNAEEVSMQSTIRVRIGSRHRGGRSQCWLLGTLHHLSTVASTVPANGDVN